MHPHRIYPLMRSARDTGQAVSIPTGEYAMDDSKAASAATAVVNAQWIVQAVNQGCVGHRCCCSSELFWPFINLTKADIGREHVLLPPSPIQGLDH